MHKRPGQILLITLMTLMVISIIVIGVIAVASRDVQQTVANQEYARLYDAAENSILQFIDRYGSTATPLTSLTSPANVPAGYTCQAESGAYRCISTTEDTRNELIISEARAITNYELTKDKSLLIDLNGYRGQIELSWSGEAALEFGLVYENAGSFAMIGDLFDTTAAVFGNNGGNPISDPQGTHALAFQNFGSGIRFNINSTTGLPGAATTRFLRVTARTTQATGSILLNIDGTSGGYPNQVRVFDSYGYVVGGATDVLANVVTQIPLFPQIAPVFHYALLVDDVVDKSL